MKHFYFFFAFLFFVSFLSSETLSQLTEVTAPNLHTEVPVYEDENGVRYSTLVTVNFDTCIINLIEFEVDAEISDISDGDIETYFYSLDSRYGKFNLVKAIPDAEWGDTLRLNKRTGATVYIRDMSQIFQIQFEELVPIDTIINELLLYNHIKSAEEPFFCYSLVEPNDYFFQNGEQWGLYIINAEEAWDISTGSDDIIISISDAPTFQTSWHLEIVNKVAYNNYSNPIAGHGLIVAGIAGAETDNTIGIASLGWESMLGFDQSNYIGVNNAVNSGADVINMSWLGQNSLLENAIYNALVQGIICVAGAGNSGNLPFVAYPAAYNFPDVGQVISVSATQFDRQPGYGEEWVFGWNYSPGTDPLTDPTNSFIDVTAPGVGIMTTVQYGYNNLGGGTSFSTPFVSALAALILSIDSTLSVIEVYDIIAHTADKIVNKVFPQHLYYQWNYNGFYDKMWNRYMGYGRINAHDALNVANGAPFRPKNLTLSSNQYDQVVLNWQIYDHSRVDKYLIYRVLTDEDEPSSWDDPIEELDAWEGFPNPQLVISWTDVDAILNTVESPYKLFYRIKAVSQESLESLPSNFDAINAVLAKSRIKSYKSDLNYSLENNYPNPFNPETQIKFSIPEPGYITLTVYDILGNKIFDLVNEKKEAGTYSASFNAANLSSGMYFYSINVNGYSETKKMLLLK